MNQIKVISFTHSREIRRLEHRKQGMNSFVIPMDRRRSMSQETLQPGLLSFFFLDTKIEV